MRIISVYIHNFSLAVTTLNKLIWKFLKVFFFFGFICLCPNDMFVFSPLIFAYFPQIILIYFSIFRPYNSEYKCMLFW